MTPEEIKRIRKQLHRTQEGMALILQTTAMTVSRWELGSVAPSPVFEKKLRKLQSYLTSKKEVPE